MFFFLSVSSFSKSVLLRVDWLLQFIFLYPVASFVWCLHWINDSIVLFLSRILSFFHSVPKRNLFSFLHSTERFYVSFLALTTFGIFLIAFFLCSLSHSRLESALDEWAYSPSDKNDPTVYTHPHNVTFLFIYLTIFCCCCCCFFFFFSVHLSQCDSVIIYPAV